MVPASNRDDVERSRPRRQRPRAGVRDHHRFAAHQIAAFRDVLVGMHDEHHTAFQYSLIALDDIARPIRGDTEAVAAHPHIGRPAIIAVAGLLNDAVDGARDISDRGTGATCYEACAHGILQYGEFLADHRPRLADDRGAADL